MEITHGRDMTYQAHGMAHRSTGLGFKYLSKGHENTPENYILVLGKQKSFYSPRHRHNFDQFRYAVQGDFSLTPTLNLKEGQLAYHPEGVYYGPQDDGPEERVLLVLQCGGASGQGFLSYDQLRAANQALSKIGKFESGKYFAHEGAEPVDGYEANWTFANGGRELVYPEGRYHEPICMNPDGFSYRRVTGKSGCEHVLKKTLGVFSERETRAEMILIEEGGVFDVRAENEIHLFYTMRGNAKVGDEVLTAESTVKLGPGSQCTIVASPMVELLHFVMPVLSNTTG